MVDDEPEEAPQVEELPEQARIRTEELLHEGTGEPEQHGGA